MNVSIIIPNFNGQELLSKQLEALAATAKGSEIIVVDDASTDGSVNFLKKHYPKIKLIEKVTNSGFASTVNLGVKAASHELIMLLNTDTIPSKGFLSGLVDHFKDEKVFAVGCLDESVEGIGIVRRGRGVGEFKSGFLLHGAGDTTKKNTLWASGGSSMFRKSIWERLGGMSEIYNPFYWEDIDLSFRALKSGYSVIFEPEVAVRHEHTRGSIHSNFTPQDIKIISMRNQFLFVWLNITDWSFLLLHVLWLPYHLVMAIFHNDQSMLRGFGRALLSLPQVVREKSVRRQFFVKTDHEVLKPFAYESI